MDIQELPIFVEENLIETYVLTHPRHFNIIRHVIYCMYVYLQVSVVFATIVMVLYKNIDKV